MKTLTVSSVNVAGNNVTITASISDANYTQAAQQVTIADYPNNPNWSRLIQLSGQAQFIKRYGSNSVAIPVSSIALMAYSIENSLTYAPYISSQPNNTSAAAPNAASFAVTVDSEVPVTYFWRYANTANYANNTWGNVSGGVYSNGTSAAMNISNSAGLNGYHYQCTISSTIGNTVSDAALLTVT